MKRTAGRKYHRGRYWIQQRDKAFERAGGICEISGEDLFSVKHGEDCTDGLCETFDEGYCKYTWRRAVHHVIAERAARRIVPGCDPHCDGNLVTITSSLHAKITAAERKLHRVDIVGYKQELNRLGVPPELFDRALTALCESAKK